MNVVSQDMTPEAINSLPFNRETKPPLPSVNFRFWDLPCGAWEAVGSLMGLTGWEKEVVSCLV